MICQLYYLLSEWILFLEVEGRKTLKKKNAFQWDAYRPLQWPPLDVSNGGGVCLLGGVPSGGCAFWKGGLPFRGSTFQGLCLPEGSTSGGGSALPPPCEQTKASKNIYIPLWSVIEIKFIVVCLLAKFYRTKSSGYGNVYDVGATSLRFPQFVYVYSS